ncbi:MAG: ATP-binding protein [Mucilaginibacter sp.]
MKRFEYLLCLFFLLSGAFALKAQMKPVLPLKKLPVNTINYEQGLLNNETSAVITDTLGFTWISTSTGLQRYNGYTLENIDPVIDHDTVKIKSQVYFYRLQNGNLWISCKKGMLEYNPFKNVFKNIIPINSTSDELFAIVPVTETPEGIWCLKERSGMVIYDKKGLMKKMLPSIDTQILDRLIRSYYLEYQSIITANQDHIFIRTGTNTILDFNTSDHHYDVINKPNAILGIGCNSKYYYISTRFDILKFQISDKKQVGRYPLKNITGQPVIFSCVYAIGNNRLIASANGQVIEFDADLRNPKLLTTFSGQPLLLTGMVEHIYHDAFERIWLLTNDDIKRLQDKEIPFSYLKYPDARNNFIRSLYYDEQTKLLLAGCISGGLQVYDSSSNPLWHDPLLTNEVKDILAIDKLNANIYLIITWNHGWYLLNLPKKSLTEFNFSADKNLKKLIYNNAFPNNIQRLNDSTILVASIYNIFRCVFRGNDLRSAKPMLPFFKNIDDRINCFHYARDGTLWSGQQLGFVYIMAKNGTVKTINLPERFTVRCIAEDGYHHIWIGTSSGLYVYSPAGKLMKSFYKKSGLLNDCIYSLLPLPAKSSVIAGSNMGLSDVSLNGNIKNYTKELGLQDNEFNTAAAFIDASGKFYFGGVNGISAFYPSALKVSQSKPILNLTKLGVNDSTYKSSGIWKGDTIRLKYNQNHVQFDFAAMGPLNADKYFYKYRLIGFENHWQNTHQPVGIRYILQPGTYTLEVVCSSDLSGSEVKKNILIIIRQPWWLTWWSFVIIGLCAIGSVVLIVSFYNKRRYQKTLQELIVKQRLQNQREHISRDLHDSLGAQVNAIFYGTELLKGKKDPEHKLVENLHDTARDMLTVLRETLWAMKITEVDAADVWLRVLNFARKISTHYSDIKMNISGKPPVELTINASMALNMILIVQEAINNAVRHSEASVITIISYASASSWRIEITDDGNGFDLLEIKGKAESYGLENMAERAKESDIHFVINSVPSHGTKVLLEIDFKIMKAQLN